MASIFTRIIRGEIPCYKVAENDRAIAFLDIRPLTVGHTLVVPKTEVDSVFDLDDQDYAAVFDLVRNVAEAQKHEIPCNRVGLSVLGFEVPHAHVHVVQVGQRRRVAGHQRRHPADEGRQASQRERVID